MKKNLFLTLILLALLSCNKDEPTDPGIVQKTLTVESIIGTANGKIDPTRKGFIDLYDGLAYSQTEAKSNSSKIDFAYNYHDEGCNTCRFFENVKAMSTRTHYVDGFSAITNSQIEMAISVTKFDNIKTSADIEKIFTDEKIMLNHLADITNRKTDVALGKVFAFVDKNGKKGFFSIGDYAANVPTGDKATLTLTIKIQK